MSHPTEATVIVTGAFNKNPRSVYLSGFNDEEYAIKADYSKLKEAWL